MRTYIVTGTVQGIGLEIKDKLLASGHKVIGVDKQSDSTSHDNYVFHHFDLVDRQNTLDFVTTVSDGSIDGLVNNAGEVYLEKWNALSYETWDRTLAVNLTAPLVLTHA